LELTSFPNRLDESVFNAVVDINKRPRACPIQDLAVVPALAMRAPSLTASDEILSLKRRVASANESLSDILETVRYVLGVGRAESLDPRQGVLS